MNTVFAPRQRGFQDPSATLWTSLRYFSITRLVIAAILMGAALMSNNQSFLGEMAPVLFRQTSISYFVTAALLAYLAGTYQRFFYPQLGAQLLLDLVGLSLLVYASGGARGGLQVLFLLPVAGAAILTPASWALGFAAACAIAILGETILRELAQDDAASFLQAGLYGAACFAMALVMNRLAARLLTQQQIAEDRGARLQNQQEVNRLVISDMEDGVLILSEDGEPRALNPAAMRMLFIDDDYDLIRHGWGKHAAGITIRNHFWEWVVEPNMVTDALEVVVVNPDHGGVTEYRIRARFFMHARRITGGDHVVLLEDLQSLEERAQHLKLASMGRLTASIAHEIRNPLSAINHASALLAEEAVGLVESSQGNPLQHKAAEMQLRMLQIVQDNTRRLDRIVQDILQLSKRTVSEPDTILLDDYLEALVDEFCRDQKLPRARVRLMIESEPMIRFNREQLRQVLINLLQNASRYASDRDGSIVMKAVPAVARDAATQMRQHAIARVKLERIELMVQDDGAPIGIDVRPQLFEPFFTTDHKGTGLGLYLARELCVANGATLSYVAHADENIKGSFVVNAAAALYRL